LFRCSFVFTDYDALPTQPIIVTGDIHTVYEKKKYLK